MIWIDSRIGSRELYPKTRKGIPRDLTHLDFADAMFIGNGPDDSLIPVGIERKTITDLLNSIFTGRLTSHQLIGLLRTYQYVYLLVEGIYRSNPRNGILERWYKSTKWIPISLGSRKFMGRQVNNYLNRLSIFYNVKVVRTADLAQSGHWLSDVYSWWTKPWNAHNAHAGFYVHPLQPRVQQDGDPVPVAQLSEPPFIQRVIKEFAGVGWKRSEVMMEHYPTMESLVRTNRKGLVKVPGVGKQLADSIFREVHGK